MGLASTDTVSVERSEIEPTRTLIARELETNKNIVRTRPSLRSSSPRARSFLLARVNRNDEYITLQSLPIVFWIPFTVWGLTLPVGCGPWLLRFALLLCPFAVYSGWAVITYTGSGLNYSSIFLYFLVVTLPLGLALESSRAALQKEFAGREKKMQLVSNAIFSLMLSLFVPLLYFTSEALRGQQALIEANLLYRANTPYCTYNDSVARWGNIPYVGCFLIGDYRDGIASVPVWKNATSYLNRTEALLLVDAGSIGTELSTRDFRRFQAVKHFENEYAEVFFVSLIQAEVLTQTAFAGVIFSLVLKVSLKRVASFTLFYNMPWLLVAALAALLEFFLAFLLPQTNLIPYGADTFQYNFVVIGLYNVALWRISVICVTGGYQPYRRLMQSLWTWLLQDTRPEPAPPGETVAEKRTTTSARSQASRPSSDDDSDGEIEISSIWIQ